VAFNLVKGYKKKVYAGEKASMAWERLKNKCELSSSASLVKLEKQFRQCSLKKGQDPDIWITELEDYRMRLEELGSSISDNQFILNILNNMTDDYDLQLAMMEKQVTDKSNPLTIDKIRDNLNLRFERLNEKQNEESENDNNQDDAFFGGQFKGKCQNCGAIGHKAIDCKLKTNQNGGQNSRNHNNFQKYASNGAYCTYCCCPGHTKSNFYKLKNKPNRNSGTRNNGGQGHRISNSNDVAFTTIAMKNNFANDLWILDSGASCHYCQSVEELSDVKKIDELIKIGNGDSMKAIKIGNLKCEVTQINGEKFTVTKNDVKYVPSLCLNLFSLKKALKKGFKVSNDGVVVSLNYKHVKLAFDRVIHATDGCVTGVLMEPILSNNINGFANASISNVRIYDINHLHKLFGHYGQEILNKTIKMYGFKSSGSLDTCEQCAIAKTRQKNVKKNWLGSSNSPGEYLYVDISSIKERSFGGAKFWALIIDDYTDYCWSFVMKNKSDIKARIKTLLADLKIANWIVKFIRCDDAGENMTMKNDPEIKSFGIKFEFSGTRPAQRNGKIERKFQTLCGRIRAMLNGAGLEGELRDKIWVDCVMNVTYLSNIISTKLIYKSPFELFYGEKPILHNNLKMFGEVGVVTTKERIQAKLSNRRTTCMFIGYMKNHSRSVYRMLNLTINSIINSRDIIWLNKTYRELKDNK
jgi:hypothetical protein